MAKLLCYAIKARFFKALTTISSDCSFKVLSSSIKVFSYSDKILGTCASCHVPKDSRLLYFLKSICKLLSCSYFLSWSLTTEEKGHYWMRHSTKSSQEAGRLPSSL